jgi:hypothetical protein
MKLFASTMEEASSEANVNKAAKLESRVWFILRCRLPHCGGQIKIGGRLTTATV